MQGRGLGCQSAGGRCNAKILLRPPHPQVHPATAGRSMGFHVTECGVGLTGGQFAEGRAEGVTCTGAGEGPGEGGAEP